MAKLYILPSPVNPAYVYHAQYLLDQRMVYPCFLSKNTKVYPVRMDWTTSLNDERLLTRGMSVDGANMLDLTYGDDDDISDLKMVRFTVPISGYIGFLCLVEL